MPVQNIPDDFHFQLNNKQGRNTMKKFKDIALIVFVLCLTMLIFSCGKKTTEPETEKVATPIFSPTAGAYDEVLHVTIQCSTKGATILYTTDGSKPDSSSLTYSAPIMVNSDATIIAQAFKDGWIESDIASVDYTINLDCTEMVFVPGGTFIMGDSRFEGDTDFHLPTHSVTLNSFYMDKYLVTQGEYEAIVGSIPYLGVGKGDNYPIYNVNWYDAIAYCNLRSMNEGLTPAYTIDGITDPADWVLSYEMIVMCDWVADGYRLPTEAEWEYAARGGTNDPDYLYSGSDNFDEVAWCNVNSGGKTHPVGEKAPNGLGIYDMSGNLWEWCWDWYDRYSSDSLDNPTGPESGNRRSIRGGSWTFNAGNCRVGNRGCDYPIRKGTVIGFRVCRNAN